MNPFIRRLISLRSKVAPSYSLIPSAARRGRTILHVDALERRDVPATFLVTNSADTGAGSLRQAIASSNASVGTTDTIVFDPFFFNINRTISLGSALSITDPVVIQGPVNPTTLVPRVTLQGNNTFGLINDTASTASLSGMTLTGGGGVATGGGISVAAGATLQLDLMQVTNSRSTSAGGGIAVGAGGFLSVNRSTISGNTTLKYGGGIYFADGGSLALTNSTVSGNSTSLTSGGLTPDPTDYTGGGGISFSGIASPTPPAGFTSKVLLIQNSTIANNTTNGSGGGVLLNNFTNELRVQNSTVSGNTATNVNATQGGGGIARPGTGTGSITLFASIVAKNTNGGATGRPDVFSAGFVQANYSAIGSSSGFTLGGASGNNIAPGTNLGLSPILGNIGGPTQVLGLTGFSPLIDAGPLTYPALATDQRGAGYPRVSGSALDIGAVEVQSAPAVATMWPTSILPTSSISPPAATQPTNSSSVVFTVVFSGSVNGVSNINFDVVTTGTVATNPNTSWVVSPVGLTPTTTWTVTVTGVTGTGNLQLQLANSSFITPSLAPLPTPLPLSSPVVTVDHTGPTLDVTFGTNGFTQTSSNPLGAGATTATYTVAFTEGVIGLSQSNFTVQQTGSVSGATVTGVTAVNPVTDSITQRVTATQWQVTVGGWSGTQFGTVGITLANMTGATDLAGNNVTLPTVPPPLPFPALLPGVGPTYSVGTSVASITPAVTATNGSTVNFFVTFNRAVTGVQASNFQLVTSAGVSGTIGTPTTADGGLTWTVQVTAIAGQGTLALQMVNTTGNSPTATNPFPFTSGNVIHDTVAPTITSLAPFTPATTANPTNLNTVSFLATFADATSNAVTGLDAADFTVTGTLAGQSGVAITGFQALPAPPGTPSLTYRIDVSTGGAGLAGTLGLQLAGTNSIFDLAGNQMTNSIPNNPTYTVDHIAPTVSFALDPVTATNATTVHYLVTFSEPVGHLVGGGLNLLTTADFGVTTSGGTFTPAPTVQAVSGSGTTWDVYVSVPAGSTPAAGGQVFLRTNATATDAAGNATPAATSATAYLVDTTPPQVTSIVANGPALTNSAAVTYTVTFSEPVAGDDQLGYTNFTLSGAGSVGASVTAVTGTGNTRTVTVQTAADGALTLNLASAGAITDTSVLPLSNPLTGTPVLGGASGTVTVDNTHPFVTAITPVGAAYTNGNPLQFTVTFSEAVTGLDATAPANANLRLVSPTIQSPAIVSVTGSGTTYTVTVSTGIGDGTLALELFNTAGIKDLAGNTLSGPFTGVPFTIDHTSPTVTSITPATPATFAPTIDFDVHFSEPVSGLDPAGSDFGVVSTGVAGAAITGVSGFGTDWTVTVNTGTGDGTIGVYLVSPVPVTGAVIDQAGNPLQAGPYTASTAEIDKTPPTVTITPAPGQPTTTNTLPIRLVAKFSEIVTGFGPGSLSFGGSVAPGSVSVSGSGTTYTITLGAVPGSGTITVNAPTGAGRDAAGNPSTAAGPLNLTYFRPVPTKPDAYSTSARTTLAVDAAHGVSANDGDANTPAGTVTLASPPALPDGTPAGTVTLHPDGSFVFTANPGVTGDVTFTYTASDGLTNSQPVPVTVSVLGRTSYSVEAAGPGGGPVINVLAPDGKIVRTFFAYDPAFTGGVQVASGDLNGDGVDDIIAGTGVGGGPNVKVFDGATGELLYSFFAYEDSFRGGVQVAVADVNHDGKPDVITGTGVGGGPRVRVFDLSSGKPAAIYDFMAYADSFRGGVMVGGGDVDGDGLAEILVGAGAGGGPHVKAYRTPSLQAIRSFYAFDASFGGGVSIAVGDVYGDGTPDIIVGATSGSQVAAFNGRTGTKVADIPFTYPQPTGGVRVATQDTNNDGIGDVLLMATGPGDPPRVVRMNLTTLTPVDEVIDYPFDFRGGLYVG